MPSKDIAGERQTMGISLSYWMLVLVTLAIGLASTWYVNHTLKKYQQIGVSNGMTGADAARRMLAYYGIRNVPVNCGQEGQDFFDPRTNAVTLSPSAYNGRSITALATACHEVGHAYQYAENYTPMKIRTSIVPVVNVASNVWIFLLMAGIMFQMFQLIDVAIVMYALVVLFALVTLPVEFDASGRALTYMKTIGLPQVEQQGSAAVLRSCAMTYVASALISVLQLLYLLGQRR